jgi:hypothetical protein
MKIIEIESSILKAANLFASKHDVRYYLCGINLNKRGAVEASDGHTGFISNQEVLKEIDESLIIKIHGNIPAKSGIASIEVIDKEKGVITFELNQTILAFSIVDGKFPDLLRVLPKDSSAEAVKEIGMNSDYILRAQKAAKILDPRSHALRLNFYGPSSAFKATVLSPYGKCEILIMPMRT